MKEKIEVKIKLQLETEYTQIYVAENYDFYKHISILNEEILPIKKDTEFITIYYNKDCCIEFVKINNNWRFNSNQDECAYKQMKAHVLFWTEVCLLLNKSQKEVF